MPQTQAVRTFRVSRTAIHNWMKAVREGGERALAARPQGRPKRSTLKGRQAATTVRLIADRCPCPDHVKLPFALWTRQAVGDLIEQRCGIRLSVWTVERLLR